MVKHHRIGHVRIKPSMDFLGCLTHYPIRTSPRPHGPRVFLKFFEWSNGAVLPWQPSMAELGGSKGSSLGRLPVASNLGSLAESPHHGLRGWGETPVFPRQTMAIWRTGKIVEQNIGLVFGDWSNDFSPKNGWIDSWGSRGWNAIQCALWPLKMGSDTWNVKQMPILAHAVPALFRTPALTFVSWSPLRTLHHWSCGILGGLGDWGAWSNPTLEIQVDQAPQSPND